MTAREKFNLGQRVELTPEAYRMNIGNRRNTRTGVVRGFGKGTETVRVQVDGMASTSSYHKNFWAPMLAARKEVKP